MSMKKWTDEELISTRENLETWEKRSNSSGGSKLWLLTALLGAFAISTGVAFIFLDGIDVMSVILIIMGTVTCFSWYRSDKQRKDNIAFLDEIRKEIKSRKLKDITKSEDKGSEQVGEIKADNKKELSAAKTQAADKN
ncbi:hypothetical protein [Nitrosomonas sp.]|uniref:hypothetical protein n=1 Tax=Nitrosomonas sp. TaxID=42353 RepID=UPI0025DFA9E1|nr:hypothetical protein [Nitrosomonas sp.]MBV6446817.1 hypothetical protein [Nitrosomonas sp.]